MTKALVYVEIDVPFCALTYGVAPCAATLAGPTPTGTIKCFNTPRTCQDRVNYSDAPVTFRYTQDAGYQPNEIEAIPSIIGVNFTPATVSLGKDLGTRASLAVTFKDHPWPDSAAGYDKYLSERPYDPYRQGTYWGKFRARQPFLRGKPIRLIRGTLGQSLAEMETRHFVIDSFGHNAADGKFTITGKDALKLADDDRAQAPVLSNGFLNAAITAGDTLLTLQPAGVGAEYPDSGYIAIAGKEIAAFTRDTSAGNDANTKLLLHMDGTDAATTFTDSSSGAKAVTPNGNAQLDTAQKKFGTASGLFDGSGDYLQLGDNTDWTFPASFTVDFWARWNALASTQYLFTHFTDANNRYFLNVSSAGVLTFSIISGGSTLVTMASAAGAVAADATWRHIAVVRNVNDWRIYVNGVSVANVTSAATIPNFTSSFRIGIDQGAANGFNGWLDEFRASIVARWTAAFTPPIAPYATSGEILNLTRGQLNTIAIAHDAQDRAQLLLRYTAQDAADIIRDLLVTFAGVPDSYIPIDAWRTETASYLNRQFTADIAEPTGVKQLLSELIEDAALSLWWDDIGEQIRLRVLRAIPTDAALFDAGNYLAGSFSSREQPNERRSQIWRYFAKRNALEGQTDSDNYRSVAATVDLESEADYGSSAIQKIFSRWIPFGGRAVADRANSLYLSRYVDPPRRFNFATFRSEIIVPALGQGYRLAGLGIQDDTGAATTAPIQITRLNPGDAGFQIEAEEMLVAAISDEDLNDRVITIDANTLNVDLRSLHDTLFPVPTDADVTAGVNLTVYIETGVIVGAAASTTLAASAAAFVVGTWPTGFPITLVINGRIQGGGGYGGQANATNAAIRDGKAGGVAIYTRHPIDIEVSTGEIWGGGGGGGVGAVRNPGGSIICNCGGGGGAGQAPGNGGLGGNCNSIQAEAGQPGTLTAGGLGGTADGNDGGNGGGPGIAGTDGQDSGSGTLVRAKGLGGAAGASLDGVSFVTITAGPGDVRGPQIN